MPNGKQLTLFQQGQGQARHKEKISQTEIFKPIQKSRKAIQTFLKNPQAYNDTHADDRLARMSPADRRRFMREESKGEKGREVW